MDDESDDKQTTPDDVIDELDLSAADGMETLDVSNEEARERQAKRRNDELGVDDIQDPKIREAAKKAQAQQAGEDDDEGGGTTVELNEPPEPDDDTQAIMNEMEEVADTPDEPSDNDPADPPETESVTADLDDDDVEAALDDAGLGDLKVREDIDPDHFDYEDQSFDQFSAYGDEANVEYNGAVFLFKHPDEQTQQQLINDMQSGGFGDLGPDATPEEAMQGVSMSEMMDTLITHTVERPDDIEARVADWSPFERLGLGTMCMEFLGLDALGNM